MGLPLPKVVADVGPGGPLLTSMNALNDYRINAAKARYAPLSLQAKALSEAAYSNLLGPQYLAKFMGNDSILANLTDDQKNAILSRVTNAGIGQSNANNALSQGFNQPSGNSLLNLLHDKFMNAFGGQGSQQPTSPPSQPPMQPMQSQQSQQSQQTPQMSDNSAVMNNPGASLQDQQNMGNMRPGDNYTVQGNPSTFAENIGKYKGVVGEGQESGKIRAQDIKDLNDTYFNAQTKQSTLDDINNMIGSPEIREIRQLPLAGRHEMGYYAKLGTPEQQQLVGRLYAQMGNVVKDSAGDFKGQFRSGEQQLLNGMKPNPGDTVDTMIGKTESLSVMNKMLMERTRLTSELMSRNHINKLQAQEEADKRLNGNAIRRQVHNTLNPKPTEDDIKHMMEKYKYSRDEVMKRLKAKGIL